MARKKRALSREARLKKKREESVKKAKITREMNKFIKEHKDQIITKGREDLGDISDKKLIDIFKANFRERQEDSLNLSKAKQELKKTLHTETFTGKKIIDYENIIKSMDKETKNEFRKLRGWKEGLDLENFSKINIPSGEDNIRARYKYKGQNGEIILSLLYNPDGSYQWAMRLV